MDTFADGLDAALTAAEPVRVALIGARAAALGEAAATRLVGEGAVARFPSVADCADAPFEARVADVALLGIDTVAEGRDAAMSRMLGTACRLYPARLLLLVETDGPGSDLAPEALFAFGFRRLLVHADGVVHEYRLRDYKLPPDWLNARFWANPERFAVDAVDADEGEDDEEHEYEDDDYDE